MIRFVITMAETGADAFFSEERPGDLLNVAYAFCYVFGFQVGDAEDAAQGANALAQRLRQEPAMLKDAVSRVGMLLAAAADGGRFELEIETKSRVMFDGSALKSGNSLVTMVKSSTLEQAVTLGTLWLLGREEGAMVRRCARETCARIFLAARPKQVFCSRRCASAAAFERYRADMGEEALRTKHRKTARASWRLKQRKLGRKIKTRIDDKRGA